MALQYHNSEFSEKQKTKFAELIQFLNQNNSYYQNLFKEKNINFSDDPDKIFKKLPFINKLVIRNNYDRYISRTQEELFEEFTSGSTGIPFKCVKSKSERMAASFNIWNKRRKWDKEVNLNNFVDMFNEKIYTEIGRFNDLSKENVIVFYTKILALSPRWLSGPISMFLEFAKLIEEGTVKYEKSSLQFIEFMGEFVREKDRNYLEKVFQCKTINHYGARETWCIAYECPHRRLHIQDPLIYLELKEPDINIEDKNYGEIVLTSLYNKVMPVLRYRTYDLGIINYEPCGCNDPSPSLILFESRVGDRILGKNIMGNTFFSKIFTKILGLGHKGIDNYKVIQTDEKNFDILIVKNNEYNDSTSKDITALIQKELGLDISIHFHYTDKIQRTDTGKTSVFQIKIKEK